MTGTLLLWTGLLAASPSAASDAVPAQVLADYQAARKEAGRDPTAQVRLALWCEAHGLTAERLKHLTLALLADPGNAAARSLMGQVRYRGEWKRAGEVAALVRSDSRLAEALAEYNARRARTRDTAEAQWRLALWCESRGLDAEATAHLTRVTQLDPGREAAWKKLGYKKHEGRWRTDAQIAAERAEKEAQIRANRYWSRELGQLRKLLYDPAHRDEAERRLSAITDPRAVPSVLRIFVAGGLREQLEAVHILSRIDGIPASRTLLLLGVFGRTREVQWEAKESLLDRDPSEFLGVLIGLLRDPLRYQVRSVGGPGSPGVLFVEGERFNLRRFYEVPELFTLSPQFFGWVGSTPEGLPIVVRGLEIDGFVHGDPAILDTIERRSRWLVKGARIRAAESELRLLRDVWEVEQINKRIKEYNNPIIAHLTELTGQDLPDRQAWVTWWYDQLGYRYEPGAQKPASKPILDEVDFQVSTQAPPPMIFSCFAAGTPVLTLQGPRPIETLQIGDRVLSQDTGTGALSYQPVVAVHNNPPADCLDVTLDDETLTPSTYHRFWRAGQGWAMARELEPGDLLRTPEGLVRVTAMNKHPKVPVFNLDVAENRSFFVGRRGILVHDNSLPTELSRPFDAPPDLAASVRPKP